MNLRINKSIFILTEYFTREVFISNETESGKDQEKKRVDQ